MAPTSGVVAVLPAAAAVGGNKENSYNVLNIRSITLDVISRVIILLVDHRLPVYHMAISQPHPQMCHCKLSTGITLNHYSAISQTISQTSAHFKFTIRWLAC